MPGPVRHVALNALFLDPGVSSGTETYLRGLVPELVRRHPETRFELLTSRRGARALAAEGWTQLLPLVGFPVDDDQPARRTLIELLKLPAVVRERGADLVHSLANRGPIIAGARHVVTVHDAIFFTHRTLGLVSTYGMRATVWSAARAADATITVSHAAAEDLVRHMHLKRDAITVVHSGAGTPRGGPATPEADLRSRLALGDARVVLCVGALRPHKNQELLVRALVHLPADVKVVCVGHGEGYEERLRALAASEGVAERFVLAGYVDDVDLEGLWGLAAAAAFPTRIEGFGLPVLEAMQRGVPIACSDIDVLREIAGDVAHHFDPDDPRSAAAAIDRALTSPGDAERARRRANEFTWERAADATYAVYESVLGR